MNNFLEKSTYYCCVILNVSIQCLVVALPIKPRGMFSVLEFICTLV